MYNLPTPTPTLPLPLSKTTTNMADSSDTLTAAPSSVTQSSLSIFTVFRLVISAPKLP